MHGIELHVINEKDTIPALKEFGVQWGRWTFKKKKKIIKIQGRCKGVWEPTRKPPSPSCGGGTDFLEERLRTNRVSSSNSVSAAFDAVILHPL